MKTEVMSMLQVFFILVFFIGIFYCAFSSIKSSVRKFNYNFVKRIYNDALDYLSNLTKKDYMAFEKYDIWRYCVHF